jgi:hypothetical protein
MIDAWSLGINAYAWIRFNVPIASSILELGSGKVSPLLRLDYELHSIEHNEKFVDDKTIHAPIKNGWYDLPELDIDWDLLIIDGPPQNIGRFGVLESGLIERSPVILVDDVNRPKDLDLAKRISKMTGRGMTIHKDGQKEFAII